MPIDEETHLLVSMMEESSEIAEIASRIAIRASKAIRFGLDEVQPGQDLNNAKRLAIEVGDMMSICRRLQEAGIILVDDVIRKNIKIDNFMDYSERLGKLKRK